jgi:hypothetical protein
MNAKLGAVMKVMPAGQAFLNIFGMVTEKYKLW